MAAQKPKKAEGETKVKKVKVTGFAPMKFKDFTITQKTSGRYEVMTSKGKNVNGADKEKVLLEAKLLKGSFKKAGTEDAPAT